MYKRYINSIIIIIVITMAKWTIWFFLLATITPVTFKMKTGEEPPSLEGSSLERLSRQVIQAVTQAVTQEPRTVLIIYF